MVTDQSPEAMEEVLWAAFFPDLAEAPSHILDARTSRPEFEAFFADHIRKLLLARGGRRWVSKNNYNLSRLSYLARVFPDARFLLPVRDPAAHVASLMKQHALFSRVQRESEAARQHLRLAGHFEFGLDRRPIRLGEPDAIAAIEAFWARGEEARGWARYWALAYRHVLDRLGQDPDLAARALIVRYEDLCEHSATTMSAVCRHVGAIEPAGLADGLAPPDYYAPRFTPEEHAAIAEETAAVARRVVERIETRCTAPT